MAATAQAEKDATRSVADHETGVGRQRFVCYACKHTDTYLADCQGETCKKMHVGVCPRCGEQN